MTHVEQTLNRILAHEWKQQPLKLSHIRLFEEFLHRYALWVEATANRAEYLSFNLGAMFVINCGELENKKETLRSHFFEHGVPMYLEVLILKSLCWVYALDQEIVPTLELQDPYEPVWLFYERGGTLRMNADQFIISDEVHTYFLRQSYWPEGKESPLRSLDKDYLDNLDEEPLPEQN